MRKAFCLLCVFATLLSLCACKAPTEDPTPTETTAPTQTSAPTQPTVPTLPTVPTQPTSPAPTTHTQGPFSQQNVPEFLTLLRPKFPKAGDDSLLFVAQDWCNETPAAVAAETNVQFFTYTPYMKTFLQVDNEVFGINNNNSAVPPVCENLVNTIVYDVDDDGTKDLLIAYSDFTGGSLDSGITLFNPVTKEFTRLYGTSDPSSKYILYIAEPTADEPLSFPVCRATMKYDYEDSLLVRKEYTTDSIVGHIKIADKQAEYVPILSAPAYHSYEKYYTKQNVPAFVSLLHATHPDAKKYPKAAAEDFCYNITPPEVAAQTNMQLFQFMNGLGGYVLLDNSIYKLNGTVTSAIVCDFDNDGNKDLLFTPLYRDVISGNIGSRVSVFNSVSKECISLHKSFTAMTERQSLIVMESAAGLDFPGQNEILAQLPYPVLLAESEIKYGSIPGRKITGFVGNIEIINGKPEFIAYKE